MIRESSHLFIGTGSHPVGLIAVSLFHVDIPRGSGTGGWKEEGGQEGIRDMDALFFFFTIASWSVMLNGNGKISKARQLRQTYIW